VRANWKTPLKSWNKCAESRAGVLDEVANGASGAVRFRCRLDICYSRLGPNLRRLAEGLAPFHPRARDFPAELPFVWDEATLRNGFLFTLQTDLGDIDLLGEITGVGDFDAVKANSLVVEGFGRRVSTLDLKTLIKAKRAAGRDKDLRVLPELESLLEAEEPQS
jgi:hypothetical protein